MLIYPGPYLVPFLEPSLHSYLSLFLQSPLHPISKPYLIPLYPMFVYLYASLYIPLYNPLSPLSPTFLLYSHILILGHSTICIPYWPSMTPGSITLVTHRLSPSPQPYQHQNLQQPSSPPPPPYAPPSYWLSIVV